jgi:hypothetical protein
MELNGRLWRHCAARSIVALLPAFALAQSVADVEEQRIVSERFASAEPADRAWGAFLAANYNQPAFVPQILELLKSGDWRLEITAFDALIRLHADVPETVLAPFVQTHFSAVLILMAREPRKHGDFLMSMLDLPLHDLEWEALNSVLAGAPPAGYAARLLREWTLLYTLRVYDTKLTLAAAGAPSGLCGDDGKPEPFSGFPAVGTYTLTPGISPGSVVLADAPHPVSIGRGTGGACVVPIDRDAYRLDYLRHLAGLPAEDRRTQAPASPALKWVSAAKYRRDAEAFLKDTREVVSRIRLILLARGVLTEADQDAQPQLQVGVLDQRQNRIPALPVIDWRL